MDTIAHNDYENGYKEKIRGGILLVTNSSYAWKLMVKTNDSNMGVIGSYAKSIDDFYWRATGTFAEQTSYTSMTNYDVEVARGPMGSIGAVYIDYKILLSWAQDVPGDYNLIVVYTVTTQ
ncbi:MAG: hypothetical protein ABH815_03795 [Candidatus Omnitrophota bacterium]